MRHFRRSYLKANKLGQGKHEETRTVEQPTLIIFETVLMRFTKNYQKLVHSC